MWVEGSGEGFQGGKRGEGALNRYREKNRARWDIWLQDSIY